jgi:hypothetical protein
MARITLSLASVLLLASACATSTAPASKAPVKAQSGAAATGVAADDQKLICQMERPVGSNIPKRVCRTQAQIDRERESAQDKIREMQQVRAKDAN